MPRPSALRGAAALLLCAAAALPVGAGAGAGTGTSASAAASTSTSASAAAPKPSRSAPGGPSPSPTLPEPTNAVDPARSVGGPRLASMGVVLDAPPGVPAPPKVRDVAWLIADADTGDVLAAKAAHAHLLPASTIKALTAVALLPKIPPDAVHRATASDASADGTKVGLVPGRAYTGKQLFQALIMASANDAAYALADANGGRAETVAELNARARELGAHDTVVKDPSGLDAPGQRSSAYDLALIGRAALADPAFVRYATTREADFPGKRDKKTKKRKKYVIGNHNRLLYNYPGTIGVKNGFTTVAHRTFIGAARRGGKTYLVTEMYGLDSGWRPPAELLDWAFDHGSEVTPVGRLVQPGEVPALPSPSANPSTSTSTSPSPSTSTAPTSSAALAPAGSPGRTTTQAAAPDAPRSAPAGIAAEPAGPWVGAATLAAIVLLVAALGWRARRRAGEHPGDAGSPG